MIVGISGRKQTGKSTIANIIHGLSIRERGLVKDWNIGANGELMILTENSNGEEGWGEFDISRGDDQFSEYAELNMWPYVKLYSFADHLKWICVNLFDIPFECCFGTDEQKNQPQEHLLWENMPGVMTPHEWSMRQGGVAAGYTQNPEEFNIKLGEGPMTAREFMQYFGTDVMRKMYEPIWVNSCIKKIQQEQSELAIIADVRFPNEAKVIEEAGGTVLRIKRNTKKDDHISESSLDNYTFTNYIENNSSIESLIVKVKEFYHKIKEKNASNIC